jgi:hypothetical protein
MCSSFLTPRDLRNRSEATSLLFFPSSVSPVLFPLRGARERSEMPKLFPNGSLISRGSAGLRMVQVDAWLWYTPADPANPFTACPWRAD